MIKVSWSQANSRGRLAAPAVEHGPLVGQEATAAGNDEVQEPEPGDSPEEKDKDKKKGKKSKK